MQGEVYYLSHWETKFVRLPHRNNHRNKTKTFLSFVYLATRSQRPEHSLRQFLFYEPLPAPHYYFQSRYSTFSIDDIFLIWTVQHESVLGGILYNITVCLIQLACLGLSGICTTCYCVHIVEPAKTLFAENLTGNIVSQVKNVKMNGTNNQYCLFFCPLLLYASGETEAMQ